MKTIGHHFVVALQQLRLVLPLLLLWRPDVSLQASTNAIIPYGVRAWQTDDGLPQNSVHAITQTGEGYLWVGTREGLVRFDGVRFADEKSAIRQIGNLRYALVSSKPRFSSVWRFARNLPQIRPRADP